MSKTVHHFRYVAYVDVIITLIILYRAYCIFQELTTFNGSSLRMDNSILTEQDLEDLYCWVDEVPLSRFKRNIARDFADGVLMAEIICHFRPRVVELHNYRPASNTQMKIYNWETLNKKVFKKLGFSLPQNMLEDVACGRAGAIERVLHLVKNKIEHHNQLYEEDQEEEDDHDVFDQEGSVHMIKAVLHKSPMKGNGKTGTTMEVEQLRAAVELLQIKTEKLEALLRLKDARIKSLTEKLLGVSCHPTA